MERKAISPLLTLAVAACLARVGMGGQSAPPPYPGTVFISDALVWTSPPKFLGHRYKTAPGSILIFHRSGELDLVSALLYRDDQGISVDLKSGYIIRKGVWSTL